MERSVRRTVIITLASAVFVSALPDGAPPEVCSSMIPGHGVQPQTSEPPYELKTDVLDGGRVMITIEPKKSGDTFKGFMLQMRDKDGAPFGEFEPEIESKLLNCLPGEKNAITHSGDTAKHQMKITWKAPASVNGEKYKGEANPIATIAREKNEFWVGVKTDPLHINP